MSRNLQSPFKCLTIVLLMAIIVLSLVPAEFRPEPGLPHNIEHGAIFALLGGAMVLGYRLRFSAWVTLGPLFAALIEVLQLGVPGRHARLSDFLVDAGTVLLGSACAIFLLKIQQTRVSRVANAKGKNNITFLR
jgi:membrane associated rhomboid family serine protease